MTLHKYLNFGSIFHVCSILQAASRVSCHCTQQQPIHINQTGTSFKSTCFKQPLAAPTVTHSLADTVGCGLAGDASVWSFFGAPSAFSGSDRTAQSRVPDVQGHFRELETSPACSSAVPAMERQGGHLLQAQPAPVPGRSPPCKHPCWNSLLGKIHQHNSD